MRCCPPEVALGTVLVDGKVETSRGILGVVLTVNLERIDIGVGRIVWVFQVVDLDLCSLLKCLPCFSVLITVSSRYNLEYSSRTRAIGLTVFLHPVCIGSLDVEVGGILILALLVAKEAESARCAGEQLVCL